MARDLDTRVKVIGAPVVREPDGLAMSSRNVYLSAQERAVAPVLYRTMKGIAKAARADAPLPALLDDGRAAVTRAGFALDYLEARHATTLAPLASPKDGPVRLLIAARIGRTRLIDNVKV
jgi:pantoate--beta-alanine ligase